ncbi:hypothetical protein O3Q37_00240 [Enterococcus lactis]
MQTKNKVDHITEDDKYMFSKGTLDFIGMNYYASSVAKYEGAAEEKSAWFGGLQNPYLMTSKWGGPLIRWDYDIR